MTLSSNYVMVLFKVHLVLALHAIDTYLSFLFVCSIEFDRDDELFATAGVSRRIKVFDFATVLSDHQSLRC